MMSRILNHGAVLAVAACMVSVAATAQAADNGRRLTERQIDEVVEAARASFEVPGLAIAVIQPGQATYLKGYGVVDHRSPTPVTADTLFGIGSISKAFTTTTIALLEQEGRLDWDDPLINHLPEFRLSDPWVTREFTIRDMVTHRAGLPPYAGDLVMLNDSKANLPSIYHALANLEPKSSFRTEYAYDNLLYIVAGDLIKRVTGRSWQDEVQARFLTRLDMKTCVPDERQLGPDANRAIAHDYSDGKLEIVDFPMPAITLPAGGIFCNARGMAQWMAFNLDPSKGPELDAVRRAELYSPVTLMPVNRQASPYQPGTTFSAYALGWTVQDNFGHREVQHGGGLPGMVSYLSLYPDDGFGVMVMTNKTSGAARAIAQQLAALKFSANPVRAIADQGRAEMAAVRAAQAEVAGAGNGPATDQAARPALPLAQYVGRYDDAWFGAVEVRADDQGLIMDLGSDAMTGRLRHIDGDRFIAAWRDRGLNADAYVNFRVNPVGEVSSIEMAPVSPRTDPSYNFRDLRLVRQKEQP
ncbi:serine hydrolase [Brevundimonas diminuta]|uniref:serine hydrolase n=1 Tax=Brevundimonas diminuta TaxID=293 RepID=UPI003D07E557